MSALEWDALPRVHADWTTKHQLKRKKVEVIAQDDELWSELWAATGRGFRWPAHTAPHFHPFEPNDIQSRELAVFPSGLSVADGAVIGGSFVLASTSTALGAISLV